MFSLRVPRNLALSAVFLLCSVVAANFLLKSRPFHVYLALEPADQVQVVFFGEANETRAECQAAASRMAAKLAITCPTCRVARNQCVNEPTDEQRKALADKPQFMPVMRLSQGAVVFLSDSMQLAVAACQETARQSSRSLARPIRCATPQQSQSSLSPRILGQFREIGLPATALGLAGLFFVVGAGVYRRARRSEVTEARFFFIAGALNQEHAKRVFDICVAAVCILAFFPALLAIPLLIKLVHPRCPVLVGVPAIGRRGRTFPMYKFSSMVPDAHKVLTELLKQDERLRQEWERDVKLTKDPRLLPVIGAFLRKTSLNELPQLFNVLKGDMSIVGPRPISKEEESKYIEFGGPDLLKQRHSIRPGITGLWQISGRNDTSYRDRVLIDAQYLREKSLSLDLKILLKTVLIVVRGAGAY